MNTHVLLNLVHLLVFGPLLLYIGLGYTIPLWIVTLLGAFIVIYQLYKTYVHYSQKEAIWVNLFHVLIVGPALIAYGLSGERMARELILMLSFAAFGYHGYYLLQSI